MQKYKLIDQIGEGAFSIVLKAQSIKTGKEFAIKCMKNHFDSMEQVNNLREIQALRRLSPHPHIVQLLEVLYDEPTGRLALVFELMEKNLYEAIKGRRNHLSEQKVKAYMYQVLKAIYHMHKLGIFHRDIKPENILVVNDTIKLADLGSCRGIFSKQPYTEYISTRWYRAPECLLTDGYYGYKMDMWGYGCVFFEILSLFPLFPGSDEADQVNKIHNVLGTPSKEILDKFKKYGSSHMDFNFPQKKGTGISKLIPHISPECIDLIENLLVYNPEDRLSAKEALKHPYFKDLYEQDKRIQAQMNTGPSHTLRGHSQDYHSDNQSETPNNLSQNSNQINININSTGTVSSNNMNINLNFGKKNKILPDIKQSFNEKKGFNHSEESDLEQSLPPISKHDLGKKHYGPVNGPPKKYNKYPPSYSNDVTPNNYAPGKKLPFAPAKINLQITGQKKSYVSPYSQKAIIAHKQHY